MNEHNLQVERSLLQKAVRRGNTNIVDMVVKYLLSVGDSKWLHKRLAVMVYEECWTMGNQITSGKLLEQYRDLTLSVKNKDAAGLATLATKYYEGDWSAKRGSNSQRATIESVANAIGDPAAFWRWIRDSQSLAISKHFGRIKAAKVLVPKASFDTDKAMMFAATYFAAKDTVPLTANAQPQTNPNPIPDFPYWIAFDKHTLQGKEIIIEACQKNNVLPYRGMQLAFYLEGAQCNQMTASPYWYLAKSWQFDHMKFTATQADIVWNKLKPVIIELTKKKAAELKDRIEKGGEGVDNGDDQLLLI